MLEALTLTKTYDGVPAVDGVELPGVPACRF